MKTNPAHLLDGGIPAGFHIGDCRPAAIDEHCGLLAHDPSAGAAQPGPAAAAAPGAEPLLPVAVVVAEERVPAPLAEADQGVATVGLAVMGAGR